MSGDKVSLLFEIPADDLAHARGLVEPQLNISFRLHDSLYYGGDYYRWENQNSGELLRIMENFVDDGEHFEDSFPDAALLLVVEGTRREEHYVSALATVGRLLRRTPWRVQS